MEYSFYCNDAAGNHLSRTDECILTADGSTFGDNGFSKLTLSGAVGGHARLYIDGESAGVIYGGGSYIDISQTKKITISFWGEGTAYEETITAQLLP